MEINMIYEPIQCDLKSHEPKDLAKSIWNFFLFQYDSARKEEINLRCEYEACLSANNSAKIDYEREADLGFGGFQPPYNEHYLKQQQEEMIQASKNLEDAKALMNFIRDRFVDKFIES